MKNSSKDKKKNIESVSDLQNIIRDSFKFYTAMHSDMMFNYIKNTTSNTVMSEERIKKISDAFSKIFNKNILMAIYLTCSAASKCIPSLKNEESCNFRNFLILYTLECKVKNNTDKMIKFLQEIQEDTFKHSNKTFKFQFLACYISLYISLEDYDNAYKYSLEAIKYIYKDVELCFYSALNVIFEKQKQTEPLQNTQKIIEILLKEKYTNKKSTIENYCTMCQLSISLSKNIKDDKKFLELANYFCKKALKNTSDRLLKGDLLFVLSGFYHDLKKYYTSIGYGKIALKYTEDTNTILDTLEAIASDYYCLAKYKKAIEIYQQIMNLEISDKAKVYMQIADCQHELGEIDVMKEYVKKAYKIGSNDKEVQKTINEVYTDIENGKYDSKIHT